MQGFIDTLGLKRFAVYIFDYGAPVGLRLVIRNPEKITAIISQNGNAYEAGLLDWSDGPLYWPFGETRTRIFRRRALKDLKKTIRMPK